MSFQKKRIQVLLSAYNGEKYLARQLDSILAQRDVELSLLVRDDGSSDRTMGILNDYAGRYQAVKIYQGRNIGAQRSFFDLLSHADWSMDYYAFADQDDVWLPDKLVQAVRLLEDHPQAEPLLYAGKVIYASKDLTEQRKAACQIRKEPAIGNALVENICMGCTEVFNKQLLQLVSKKQPQCSILHDWWLYLTAACFGSVIYDERAYILYRQHGKNQVGMQRTWKERWKSRIRRFRSLKGVLSAQAEEFQRIYNNMLGPDSEVRLLAQYRTNKKKRRELILGHRLYRQHKVDDCIYKILFALKYL